LSPASFELWEAIQPLLQKKPPRSKGGRLRVPDRHPQRDRLRASYRLPVAPAAEGVGLRQQCNSLVPLARLAASRRLGAAARHATLLNWLGDAAAVD
jgi:hypothetical protein